MTLVEFLLARITEDEEAAQWAIDGKGDAGPWMVGADTALHLHATTVFRPSDWRGHLVHACDTALAADPLGVARHIARHDPARVIADVEAKRRIVALHDRAHRCAVYTQAGDSEFCEWVPAFDACSTLQLLALPYADHPDYQPEWRP